MGSPLKRATGTPTSHSKANRLLDDGLDVDEGEEEDEETLQLKLAAIEARLKLKQLQKNRGRADDETEVSSPRPSSARLQEPPSFSRPRRQSSPPAKRNKTLESDDDVQVPVSPSKRPATAIEPASPRRVVLGIDKGLKGSDVSLKRPPSAAKSAASTRPTSRLAGRDGAGSRNGDIFGSRPQSSATNDDDTRPKKSFSERIAESRSVEKTRQERSDRAERIHAHRSTGFQLDKSEMEAFSAAAEARANAPPSPTRSRPAESFSREDVLRSYNGLNGPPLKRNSTSTATTTTSGTPRGSGPYLHRRSNTLDSGSNSFSSQPEDGAVAKASDLSKFEAYSSLHLSNRVLPHSFLSRALVGKKVLRIPDLLRTVKAPDFELPEDVDGDFVVFGIVASKSEPRQVKETKRVTKQVDPFDDGLNNTDKYMVMTLTDLKWTVDLLLFNTAFPRYYRLTEGMLVAILNPTIMPPPKGKADTNRFSLSLSSSDDKVLEVGFAQDISFCKAVRKDGKTCQAWVDGRKTEFCDFHVDLQVRRTQAGRMGVNNGPGMLGPGGQSGSRTGFYGGGKRPNKNQTGLKPENGRYDMASQSVYYVAPGSKSRNGGGSGTGYNPFLSGQSASRLLDAEDEDPFIAAGMMGRGMENREERMRRKLAEQQRERDITKKLITAGGGSGVGSEYLRARTGSSSSTPNPKSEENVKPGDVTNALDPNGLRKANAVKLSPLKRGFDKPHDSGVKKTRFITAKGIKEAGRESLGGPSSEALVQASTGNNAAADDDDDDDDDELDIV